MPPLKAQVFLMPMEKLAKNKRNSFLQFALRHTFANAHERDPCKVRNLTKIRVNGTPNVVKMLKWNQTC